MSDTKVRLSRLPENEFEFDRVNIFLGANGTGKSKLLKELRETSHKFYSDRSVIYVEGGRTIKLINSLKVTRNNFGSYNTLDSAKKTHRDKRRSNLSDRVIDALMLLDKQGQEIKSAHSDAIEKWHSEGRVEVMPTRSEPPLNKLFELFAEIFPAITLELNSEDKLITCRKNGSAPYSPTELSDGEKQVLSILADIALLSENNSLILVDEPELNLNPSLAGRVWETIENDLQECVFVYTTHDIGFSMRANVNKVFVLSNNDNNISEIKNIGNIPPNELRALLGSIPAILSTSNAFITEGTSNSFDSIFYRWLLSKEDLEIVPMGGCSDVQAVANRTGVWDAIAPSVELKGIIDRDHKSDETITSLESDKCLVLKFHEAESYFCLPSIVVLVANKLGLSTPLSIVEVETTIKSELSENLLRIVAHRVFERTTLKLSVSLQNTVLKSVNTREELEDKLFQESKTQKEFAEQELSDEKISKLLDEEISRCQTILDSNNIEEILRILPAKGLISKLSTKTGAKNYYDYARACTKHIEIASFPVLKDLKSSLI